MANRFYRALGTLLARPSERADPAISLDTWASFFDSFNYGGISYPFQLQQTLQGNREEIGAGFAGYVRGAYKSNGVVFACMLLRLAVFSEARFQFRRLVKGRPGELFGTNELDILERPWENATTGDLLTRAIQDVDLAGNFFCVRRNNELRRLRPDWVTIVAGDPKDDSLTMNALGARLLGYIYHPGGPQGTDPVVPLGVEEVAHFAPVPDPLFTFRGMSWLEPVIREVMGDSAMTTHKLKFLDNGCTPNMVVSLDPQITKQAFDDWVQTFERKHTGLLNAYKTLYLGGGASVEVVGANLRQLDFKQVQGAGETRIAAAAGCPPVLVGLSEGLQSATYSNYGMARRRFADGTIRPLWRNFAGSMSTVINLPGGAELWYDDRDIPFLREDMGDEATIRQTQAATIASLVNSGFKPETVVPAVMGGDYALLQHTGLYSVQLQPPGELGEPGGPASLEPPAPNGKAAANGKGAPAVPTGGSNGNGN